MSIFKTAAFPRDYEASRAEMDKESTICWLYITLDESSLKITVSSTFMVLFYQCVPCRGENS